MIFQKLISIWMIFHLLLISLNRQFRVQFRFRPKQRPLPPYQLQQHLQELLLQQHPMVVLSAAAAAAAGRNNSTCNQSTERERKCQTPMFVAAHARAILRSDLKILVSEAKDGTSWYKESPRTCMQYVYSVLTLTLAPSFSHHPLLLLYYFTVASNAASVVTRGSRVRIGS